MAQQGIGEIKIKNYGLKKEEQKAIRQISVENSIFSDYKDELLSEEVIADLLTSYFLEYEPQSCFVAEKDGQVIGYLTGSCNVIYMRKIVKSKILPKLAKKTLQNGLLFRFSNLKLLLNLLFSYCKGEFKVPDFAYDYPATLHVNIASEYRGKMLGTILVNHFLDFLKVKKIKGIHFGVLTENAKKFFIKNGFEVLFSGKYSFLSYLSGKTIPHYIMGKKI